MIVPKIGPEAFKTYQIAAPISTHFRPATCAEVECKAYMNGWVTTVLPNSPQALYIKSARCGRRFTEASNADGTVSFTFDAGQPCFQAANHRKSLEREPIYVVREGDARGNPRGIEPRQRRAEDWVDDFAAHQQRIADVRQQG